MRLSKCIVIIFAIALILIPTSCDMLGKKIGVLFITGGIEERYKLDWWVGFVDHLFPVWPKGFLAGGSKEGATCYTLIHYASEAEAFICGVNEGTPIDAFCNEYTGTYPVPAPAVTLPFSPIASMIFFLLSSLLPATARLIRKASR
jgi:hypothetical protein